MLRLGEQPYSDNTLYYKLEIRHCSFEFQESNLVDDKTLKKEYSPCHNKFNEPWSNSPWEKYEFPHCKKKFSS